MNNKGWSSTDKVPQSQLTLCKEKKKQEKDHYMHEVCVTYLLQETGAPYE